MSLWALLWSSKIMIGMTRNNYAYYIYNTYIYKAKVRKPSNNTTVKSLYYIYVICIIIMSHSYIYIIHTYMYVSLCDV